MLYCVLIVVHVSLQHRPEENTSSNASTVISFLLATPPPFPFVSFLLPGLNLGRTNCLRRATLVLLAGLLSTA